MSPHPSASSPPGATATTASEADPSTDDRDLFAARKADPASGPKSWPSADQESPAGPIQILSIPAQVVPPKAPRPAAARPAPAASPAPVERAAEPADAGAVNRPPVSHSLGALAFGLFELQRPDPSAELRTLEQARAKPGHGREAEQRGGKPSADAFALLGEIDFLDF